MKTQRPTHYKAFEHFDGWAFTSPLGLHLRHSKYLADKLAKDLRKIHRERSKGTGAEAAMLRKFFFPRSHSLMP